jgi:hypothetical protein
LILSLACLLPATSHAAQAPALESPPEGRAIGSAGFNEMLGKQLGAESLKTEALPDGSFKLSNSVQSLSAHITQQGVAFDSIGNSSGKGGFILALQQYGREGVMQAAESSSIYEKDGVVYHTHSNGIAEKFSNTGNGIQQDFIVPIKPAGKGALEVRLGVEGATLKTKNDGLTVTVNSSQRVLTYDRLKVTDANNNSVPAHMQLHANNHISIVVDDRSAKYPLTIDPTVGDENWVSMGGIAEVNWNVYTIVCSGLNVYVGGAFTEIINGRPEHNIVKWNGSRWSLLGVMNGDVNALVVDSSGNLYAGGSFTSAGSSAANHIAKWDGFSWSALGSGVNGDVYALAVNSSGDLYAGGAFTSAGGVVANNIAKWKGIWSVLGSGVNGDVYALAVDSSYNVYAGGSFTSAGGGSSE